MLSMSKGQCLVGRGGEAVTGAMWGLAGDGGLSGQGCTLQDLSII